MADKPTIPEVIDRFRAYHEREPMWGPLHIILDNGNVSDSDVDFCIGDAERRGDSEGVELARVLRRMSRTQRLRLRELA